MSLGSWIFMAAAWCVVLSLNVFCFYNIFVRKARKGTDDPAQDGPETRRE